jgi:hypothetical protein
VPDYSVRLRNWWRSWAGQNPYEIGLLIDRCSRLREFTKAEHGQLIGAEHVKAEVWVRQDPDTRELRLYSTSQTVVLPGDGYWAHCTKIQHQSRYHAAVSAFASRGTTQGRVNYRNDGRWTHFLAVPIILPEDPHFEMPVGVVILLLHAPAVEYDGYFGDAESGLMRALAVRMKELGQEFLRPPSAS